MFREQLAQSPISHFTRASINPSRSWNCTNRHEASSDAHQPRQLTTNSTYTNSTTPTCQPNLSRNTSTPPPRCAIRCTSSNVTT